SAVVSCGLPFSPFPCLSSSSGYSSPLLLCVLPPFPPSLALGVATASGEASNSDCDCIDVAPPLVLRFFARPHLPRISTNSTAATIYRSWMHLQKTTRSGSSSSPRNVPNRVLYDQTVQSMQKL